MEEIRPQEKAIEVSEKHISSKQEKKVALSVTRTRVHPYLLLQEKTGSGNTGIEKEGASRRETILSLRRASS